MKVQDVKINEMEVPRRSEYKEENDDDGWLLDAGESWRKLILEQKCKICTLRLCTGVMIRTIHLTNIFYKSNKYVQISHFRQIFFYKSALHPPAPTQCVIITQSPCTIARFTFHLTRRGAHAEK